MRTCKSLKGLLQLHQVELISNSCAVRVTVVIESVVFYELKCGSRPVSVHGFGTLTYAGFEHFVGFLSWPLMSVKSDSCVSNLRSAGDCVKRASSLVSPIPPPRTSTGETKASTRKRNLKSLFTKCTTNPNWTMLSLPRHLNVILPTRNSENNHLL